MTTKKMGRPTDCPKEATIKIRVDKDSLEKLAVCSTQMGITRAEVIRRLIRQAYEDLQKK